MNEKEKKQKLGITPAGAGKTIMALMDITSLQDHPRRCGENYPSFLIYFSEPRITPAGAGKTITRTQYITAKWDHPRRCGENVKKSCQMM